MVTLSLSLHYLLVSGQKLSAVSFPLIVKLVALFFFLLTVTRLFFSIQFFSFSSFFFHLCLVLSHFLIFGIFSSFFHFLPFFCACSSLSLSLLHLFSSPFLLLTLQHLNIFLFSLFHSLLASLFLYNHNGISFHHLSLSHISSKLQQHPFYLSSPYLPTLHISAISLSSDTRPPVITCPNLAPSSYPWQVLGWRSTIPSWADLRR